MSQRKTYVVGPQDGYWRVKAQGAERASGVFVDKADAVARAVEFAKKQPLGQVIVKSGDGRIQDERTYGKDPCAPRG